jgi:hypothetical protein
MDLFKNNGAEFSFCRKYRYFLWRIWDDEKPLIMFIGLNPSTANEINDDPTIRRIQKFAFDWGFGGVYMLNCFPYISTNPNDLKDFGNTDTNDEQLKRIGLLCSEIIFAWGSFNIVKETGRDAELIKMFPNAKCLEINKDGSPRHPLYVPSKTLPKLFSTR